MLIQYREAIRDVADLEWSEPKSEPSTPGVTPVKEFQIKTGSTPTTLLSPSSPDSSLSSAYCALNIAVKMSFIFYVSS
jgi:hypothetical protein